jgi:hypothetical protein
MILYLGFPISKGEMYRLLCRDFLTNEHHNWWDTSDIEMYLKQKGSKLIFTHIDKNVFAFGLELNKMTGFWLPFLSVETAKKYLEEMNNLFVDEIQKLGIDLSFVTIEQMEDVPIELKNPPPILFG